MSTTDGNREPTRRQGALVDGIGYVLTLTTAVAQYLLLPKLDKRARIRARDDAGMLVR